MVAARERERAVVVHLGEPEAAVVLRDLHPQSSELLEPTDHLVGHLGLTLDAERIDLALEEASQLLEETLALLDGLGVLPRLRVDQVEPKGAQKQLPAETRKLPFAFARRLGNLARPPFAHLSGHQPPPSAARAAPRPVRTAPSM